jgi:hypothetical protein
MNELKEFSLSPITVESDHKRLSFSIRMSTQCEEKPVEIIRNDQTKSFYKYIFQDDKVSRYLSSLEDDNCLMLLDEMTNCIVQDKNVNMAVDSMYCYLDNAISNNFDKRYVKSAKNAFPRNQWFDNECKKCKRACNDFSKHNDLSIETNHAQYNSLRKKYKALIQRKKRDYQKKIRSELENFHSINQNDYWRLWENLKTCNKSHCNELITLQSFESYFKSVSCPPENAVASFDMSFLESIRSSLADQTVFDKVDNILTDHPITIEEVNQQIKYLKSKKAPGVDGISNEFYKCATENLVPPLTTLYNYIWDKGEFPDKWAEGLIQPLHKKGSQSEADNYRKLTLMACMGKIFEAILNTRLIFQSEVTLIDDPNQFGFCKNRRTTDNVFILDTLISHQKSVKKPLFLCFVDFTKAFDFINRDLLYYKLLKRGFGGKLVRLIISMFAKANARVRWNGEVGEKINSTHGVLQGGIISPKLFNLFLADIHEHLDTSQGVRVNDSIFTHLVYADDLVLISENENGLQVLLDNLAEYCKKWHLIVNCNKSKVMLFNTPKKETVSLKFLLDKQQLEIVSSFKYLGHILTTSRNIHAAMHDHIATQAQRATHLLYDNIKKTAGYLSPVLSLKMFDTHVLPILEYNNELWFNDKKIDVVEKIQMQYLKNMLGVRRQTPSIGILADCGRFPLVVRQHVSAVKYLERLNSTDCPPLLKECYQVQKQLHNAGKQCWLTKLCSALEKYNVTELSDLKAVPNRIYEYTHEMLLSDISDSNKNPKLRTYKNFKTEMRIEPYLNLDLPKNLYSSIARFRLSSHNLQIELGRHKRPYVEPNNRICQRCNLNSVEDEEHFLMVCPKWESYRLKLMRTAMAHINDFIGLGQNQQFLGILSSKIPEINIALGHFLYSSFNYDNA